MGEILLEFLSNLGSWAAADLFRKPALRLTLNVDSDGLAMETRSGDEVFCVGAQIQFTRDHDGTPRLRGVGDVLVGAPRAETCRIPLTDLLTAEGLARADATALLGAVLDVCDRTARDKLQLAKDRKLRVEIRLPPDLEFAALLVTEASLQRSQQAMRRQIPNFTRFAIQSPDV
jgi:hypothetical protein